MNEINKKDCIEELRQWLVAWTGCDIQEMADDDGEYGWPCGTCTCHLLTQLGVTEQNAQHNDPVDRTNEVWRAIIQIRENAEGAENGRK